ncbi:MAG: 50S ribosomal protein L31e [Candidatus Micrarchaeota archaeon]|nr:50S ribosomal protein L31e [Candidatus Micrarchaeota archaeon]
MANLERIYTIPLKDAYEHPRNKRGKRAIRLIQAFALRHMKAGDVRVSEGVNSAILRDGIEKPPRRIKVRMVKGDDALVRVWLIGEEETIKETADKKKKEGEDKKKTEEQAKKAADAKKAEEKKAEEAKKAAAAKPAPAPAQVAKPK